MSGEPSLYLVYKTFTTDEYNSDSWQGTQAAADAAAVEAGADFEAHQGAVTVPNSWSAGWIYNPADDTWRALDAGDLDELGQRKYAATALYAALLVGATALRGSKRKTIGRRATRLRVPCDGTLGCIRCLHERKQDLDGGATNSVGRRNVAGRFGWRDRAGIFSERAHD